MIPRHLTALSRAQASRPIRLALADGVITPSTSVLDYGCGRGADVRHLAAVGVEALGWDPHHRPGGSLRASAVVNLGYVVNVIEDVEERADVLSKAWSFATEVLVVSARLESEARPGLALPHEDGYLTRLGTFQKLYLQHELRAWIEATLGVPAVPAGPGVFYVFRDEARRQAILASRCRRDSTAIWVRRTDAEYAEHKELLAPLLAFLAERGRLPSDSELAEGDAIRQVFGSLKAASRLLKAAVGEDAWAAVEDARTQDLLVWLALGRFSRRPKFSDLPVDLQSDVRAFFTSYQAACELADELLRSAGDQTALERACRSCRVGKHTPSALYVHATALPLLPPVLRIYEGCARSYIGVVDEANLVKLHLGEPKVSYLSYPRFDADPHPLLARSLLVPLQTFRVEERDWTSSNNPPLLHRKEEFVGPEYPRRALYEKLTAQEERFGLYEHPERIGTRSGWETTLEAKRVALRGHRVVRRRPAAVS